MQKQKMATSEAGLLFNFNNINRKTNQRKLFLFLFYKLENHNIFLLLTAYKTYYFNGLFLQTYIHSHENCMPSMKNASNSGLFKNQSQFQCFTQT